MFQEPFEQSAPAQKLSATVQQVIVGDYHGAIQKLKNDILPKIGGRDQSSKKSWITCCPSFTNKKYMETTQYIAEAIELMD